MGYCGAEHIVSNEAEHQNADWPDTEILWLDASLDKLYFAVLCRAQLCGSSSFHCGQRL